MTEITHFFKRPSTSDTTIDENNEPPKKKTLKSGSTKDNTAYLKTVLHWPKDLVSDLGYKLMEGQTEVVEEIWCKTCWEFSNDRNSSVCIYHFFGLCLRHISGFCLM